MRSSLLLRTPLLLLVISPISAFAQRQNLTDAQRDGLAGPVKSVSVKSSRTEVQWQQPGGPTLVIPVWCAECEFDRQGNETKAGQITQGNFHGQITRIMRDADGQITERFVSDAASGKLVRHEVDEPSGEIQEYYDLNGKLESKSILTYDQNGHVIDKITFDSSGNRIAHILESANGDGKDKEGWGWGPDGQLQSHFRQTFNPKTRTEQFTSFDTASGADLTWTVVDGKLNSFWKSRDEPSQWGDNFSEDIGNDTSENFACHKNGTCELSRIHYTYPDSNHRSPISAEWRDEKGDLRFAAYYEYEFDANHNWTDRNIWVWDSALGERKLYESDSRSISYWPQ